MADPKKKAAPSTAVTDPLEASKIQSKPIVPPPPPEEPKVAAPVVPDAPRGAPVVRYRVAATTHISLNGQITRLNAEDIVSEESYGPDTMAKILASNAPLVKIDG